MANIVKVNHPWNVKPKDAARIQDGLRKKLILDKRFDKIEKIAGIDVSFYQGKKKGKCAIAVYSYPRLEILERAIAIRKIMYPYIPGLLTFREGPAILATYRKLRNIPDILIFDGHGIAHPREMGIASHMGIILDRPSIGCAKNMLYGVYSEPGRKKGSFSYIRHGGKIIGAALRTRYLVKCVFVSCGHKIDLKSAIDIVFKISPKYRIPEPLRMAHASSIIRQSQNRR